MTLHDVADARGRVELGPGPARFSLVMARNLLSLQQPDRLVVGTWPLGLRKRVLDKSDIREDADARVGAVETVAAANHKSAVRSLKSIEDWLATGPRVENDHIGAVCDARR